MDEWFREYREQQWRKRAKPKDMLVLLRELDQKPSERKLRLFAVACCRLTCNVAHMEREGRIAVRVAERFADRPGWSPVLARAYEVAKRQIWWLDVYWYDQRDLNNTDRFPRSKAEMAALYTAAATAQPDALTAAYGSSHHAQVEHGLQCDLLWCIFGPFLYRPVNFAAEWRTETTFALARKMYARRDFSSMPILADALQAAGCDDKELVDHCREPGPHVRGCWVVDLVLGKA